MPVLYPCVQVAATLDQKDHMGPLVPFDFYHLRSHPGLNLTPHNKTFLFEQSLGDLCVQSGSSIHFNYNLMQTVDGIGFPICNTQTSINTLLLKLTFLAS